MQAKKNLVIGLMKGYSWYLCEPFFYSFVKNVPNADMVIILDDISNFTRYQLEKMKKEFKNGELKLEPFRDEFKKIGHPANTRWKAFLDYIEKHESEYEQVLCADVRDVFFQGDIFKNFSNCGDYVGFTYFGKNYTVGYTLGKDSPMLNWFTANFGKEEAKKLSDKRTFCPSTILGTPKELAHLLRVTCENIPHYEIFGSDECTFDYVIHHNMLSIKNFIELDGETGQILHLNWVNNTHPIQIKNNLVLNTVGDVPDVVHYFDRNVFLLDFTDKFYRFKNFNFDENFTDRRSVLDQLPHLVLEEKYEMAVKILIECSFKDSKLNLAFNNQKSLAIKDEEKYSPKCDIKNYGDIVLRMWEVLLSKNLQDSTSTKLLELILQSLLKDIYSECLSLYIIEKICACIKVSEKQGHIVDLNFKKFILKRIFERTKIAVENAHIENYLSCLEMVQDLNLPTDKHWRDLTNEAHTWFRFYRSHNYREDDLKDAKEKFEKGTLYYRPYRIDADFENGGLK